MRPLTFNPGPSKITHDTYSDIKEAIASGVLEWSHRSNEFYDLSSSCIKSLCEYLRVPYGYHVIFLDSATNCWHSIAANCVAYKSTHLINGAFSKKASEAPKLLYKNIETIETEPGTQNDFINIKISKDTELVTACYNESSTGVMMREDELVALKTLAPRALIAIDATSCAGAISIPIEVADIWYFSVQKGFGLPSGFAIMLISPRAYEKSLELEKTKQNLAGIWRWSKYLEVQKIHIGETPHTPNMLSIYLLEKQCKRFLKNGGISVISENTKIKADKIWKYIDNNSMLSHFIEDINHRSYTVITIKATPSYIVEIKKRTYQNNIIIGNGYGAHKEDTFRVANFPAITDMDINTLLENL